MSAPEPTSLRDCQHAGRTEFNKRELRLDLATKLSEVSYNLETRLLLLQRRLVEEGAQIRMERTGRGRCRLVVRQPLELVQA